MVDIGAVQKKWQKRWAAAKLGEAERDESRKKFFLIWAYLTVSGFHHVGHIRGYSYADAVCRYKRMRGFNVLMPAGAHASGNGAIAKALKIQQGDKETVAHYKRYGLTAADIKKISTPEGFVSFFSKRYVSDYNQYGFLGDWRRFTVTTYPDYNKFIEWQFLTLKKKGLLVQKPYFATACVVHGPVSVDPAEMDLSKGGSAEKNEYTLIKLQYEKPNQFIVVATLRPETMYGQTNVWVDPDQIYTKVQHGKETWIVSKECAQKLTYQKEHIIVVGEIPAASMLGKKCTAPAANRPIPILPASFCDPKVGTGIVTSVPSDAPDDWMGLKDLQDSPALCKKYSLNHAEIAAIKPIAIIASKGFGGYPALEICKRLGVRSQHDREKLDAAKKEVYRTGFHTGIMMNACGEYAGMKVEDAKEKVKSMLIKKGLADTFHDLSEEVLCRCGQPVVVKKVDDQWFIRYSDQKLKEATKKHIAGMKVFPQEFHNNLPGVIDWFDDRACARQGRWLGTAIPFDKKYIVEPIADSTLYPIYYLISKYVNDGSLTTEQLTESFFNYVFLGEGSAAAVAKSTKVPLKLIETVRKDVEYWYPLDVNLGGKEHQTVHFPVFLMNHVGLLHKNQWPQGIFVNWWVVSKGGKVSKSKGGAASIADEAEKYSVDAIRLFYAHIASPYTDIAFDENELMKYRQRIERWYWLVEELRKYSEKKHQPIDDWMQSKLHSHITAVTKAMDAFEFRQATEDLYFGLYNDIQWYKRRGGTNKAVAQELLSVIATLSCPFTPFFAEELWESIGKGFVVQQQWPAVHESLLLSSAGVQEELISAAMTDIQTVKELAGMTNPKKIVLFIAESWKYDLFDELRGLFASGVRNGGELLKRIMQSPLKAHGQDITKLIPRLAQKGLPSYLDHKKEHDTLVRAADFLKKEVGCTVEIIPADKSKEPKAKQALPGKPAILIS